MIFAGLFLILGVVLFAPFLIKKIEEELEIFLFIMGCLAVTITAQWDSILVREALLEPINITFAVFIAGLVFRFFQKPIEHRVNKLACRLGLKLFVFILIIILGLISSVITAIVAALVLVEIVSCLGLKRKDLIRLVILACFSVGLGAALTPIGEPLSTIAIAKLKGLPYEAGFLFLFKHLWGYVLLSIFGFGLLGFIIMPKDCNAQAYLKASKVENFKNILSRSFKVYLFVMALIFLGKGFKPIIDTYISRMPYQGLYWVNILSAVVDNATLTAAEISPSMSLVQIKSALLGLLLAGGMLIPGNIPNIISAGKLKIKSSEWAKFGVPIGLIAMLFCFIALVLIRV